MFGSRRQIHILPSCGSRKMSSRYGPPPGSRTQVWCMTSKAALSSGQLRPDRRPRSRSPPAPPGPGRTGRPDSDLEVCMVSRHLTAIQVQRPARGDAPRDIDAGQAGGDIERMPGIPRRILAHLNSARRNLIGHDRHCPSADQRITVFPALRSEPGQAVCRSRLLTCQTRIPPNITTGSDYDPTSRTQDHPARLGAKHRAGVAGRSP